MDKNSVETYDIPIWFFNYSVGRGRDDNASHNVCDGMKKSKPVKRKLADVFFF